MSKFKEGDKLRVIRRAAHWMNNDKRPKVGDIVEVSEADTTGVYFPWGEVVAYGNDENFELSEGRTTWHPHHDVIVAWAKGAKIQYKEYKSAYEPDPWKWVDHLGISAPAWYSNIEYRVKPEPDNTAEIAGIERKMRELSESQKELADRLEKLKG